MNREEPLNNGGMCLLKFGTLKAKKAKKTCKNRNYSHVTTNLLASTETLSIGMMDDTWMVVLPTTSSGNAGTTGWLLTRIQCTTHPREDSAIGSCR